MLKNIKPRRRVEAEAYRHEFADRNEPGAGFSFDVTKNGVPVLLEAPAAENYRRCKAGELEVVDLGIQRQEWSYLEPGEGTCVCGAVVVLDGDDTDCKCGRIYNFAGQELNPRHMWVDRPHEDY